MTNELSNLIIRLANAILDAWSRYKARRAKKKE